MDAFNVESAGMTRGEFMQAVHRLARPFLWGVILVGAAVYGLMILLMGYNSLYILFPGSIVAAILLFYEMKAFGNYGKFDYEDAVVHFRFEPDRWVVIRGNDLNTRAEFTWADTAHVWKSGKDLLLVPSVKGSGNYTLPKRHLTQEQQDAILAWQQAAHKG